MRWTPLTCHAVVLLEQASVETWPPWPAGQRVWRHGSAGPQRATPRCALSQSGHFLGV